MDLAFNTYFEPKEKTALDKMVQSIQQEKQSRIIR